MPGRKTLLLAAVAALVVVPLAPARDAPLSVRLVRALSHGGRTGAVAVDLATGRVVFAHNAGMALVPASNEKLAVAYAALVALGPSYRIRTELVGEGHREGPVWRGNLVLKGRGDPTLSGAGLRGLAHRLRVLGITVDLRARMHEKIAILDGRILSSARPCHPTLASNRVRILSVS